MLFNLNSPREDDPEVLSCQISIIGSLSFYNRRFQKTKYMIEMGTYNLIYIMTKMKDLRFQLQAAIAIRKATSSRVTELLDSFVSNGLIERVVETLNKYEQ